MSCAASGPPPSVSVVLGRVMRDALGGLGMSESEFIRRSGLSRHELAQDGLRLGARRHERLRGLMRLIELADVDGGGIDRDGLARYWPTLASLWFNQPHAVQAWQDWVRFRPLIGSIDTVALHELPDRLVLEYRTDCVPEDGLPSVVANFGMLREVLRDHLAAAGPGGLQLQAELAVGRLSAQRARLQHVLQMPVRAGGGGDVHRLVLRGAALRSAQAACHPWLAQRSRAVLMADLEALQRQRVPDDLVGRIDALLCAWWDAPDGPPHPAAAEAEAAVGDAWSDPHGAIDDAAALQRAVAQALGCSRWTLRRQLDAAGLSFATLVEQLRERRLRELLPRADLSLLEVAWRTGFRSASAFSRYHRRRYGQAPSQRRRQATAG